MCSVQCCDLLDHVNAFSVTTSWWIAHLLRIQWDDHITRMITSLGWARPGQTFKEVAQHWAKPSANDRAGSLGIAAVAGQAIPSSVGVRGCDAASAQDNPMGAFASLAALHAVRRRRPPRPDSLLRHLRCCTSGVRNGGGKPLTPNTLVRGVAVRVSA